MSEKLLNQAKPEHPKRSYLERFRRNPVVLKDLRTRMRGGRAFVVLTLYLLFLSAAISIVYVIFVTSSNSIGAPNLGQHLGKAIFWMILGMELFTVSFIAPALTVGTISSERERQTYDILRTTVLPARSLVLGKLSASLAYIILLLFAALPLQSLAFLFGGIALDEVLIGNLLLIITAVSFSAIGLFFSSFTRRTLVSTVLTYTFTILFVFGLPVSILTGIALLYPVLLSSALASNVLARTLLIMAGWLFISLNPIATAVITEVILIAGQSIIYYSLPVGAGKSVPIISPWISFAIIYVLLTLMLVWLSVRFVQQIEH